MNKAEIIENTNVAKAYLKKFSLLVNAERIVECAYFPPFGKKTFFAQIVEHQKYCVVNCAYTFYADCFGNQSYSTTFCDVEKADKTAIRTGDIFCKSFIVNRPVIDELIAFVEDAGCSELDTEVCIDGEYACITVCHDTFIFCNKPDRLFEILRDISQTI